MGTKLQTIDEILIECGITHLTGKEHDAIIVAFNQYSSQENKAILLDNTDLSIKNMQLKGTDPEVVIDVNTIMGTDYGIVFIFEPPSVLISDR